MAGQQETSSAGGRDHPGVIAPPPLVLLASIALGLAVQAILPEATLDIPYMQRHILAGVLVIAAIALELSAFLAFRRAGTNVAPWKPAKALAPTGPYRFTRNPMYLGMVLLHLGIGVFFNSLPVVLMAAVFALVIHFGVILREERYLSAKFGDDYRAYLKRVRRWL